MAVVFQQLGEETWGQRLARARYPLTVRATAELLTRAGFDVSHTTITRLEALDEPPTMGRQRVTACLALLAYGIDPGEFDLADVRDLFNLEAVFARFKKIRRASPELSGRRQGDLPWVTDTPALVEALEEAA